MSSVPQGWLTKLTSAMEGTLSVSQPAQYWYAGLAHALQKISELDGVAAVADIDTPLPIWLLPV